MKIIVLKYGGSSLSTVEKIKSIAKKLDIKNSRFILVVSAMGTTTDDLINLSKEISTSPKRRELDMLLTSGERVSMALVSMALNEYGKPAISLTGSQCGIFTDERHGNARITGLNPFRVEQVLNEGSICVIAGFQGVSPITKEITTLGRGGSDTTAVAIASHFKSSECEFKKDVTSVQSADPKVVKNTKPLPHLNYQQLLDMTFWGCKVLHYRSVELAQKLSVPLKISHAEDKEGHTMIDNSKNSFEKFEVISIQSHAQVAKVLIKEKNVIKSLKAFNNLIVKNDFVFPQVISTKTTTEGTEILFVSSKDQEEGIKKVFPQNSRFDLSSVSIICNDSFSSSTLNLALSALKTMNIHESIFSTQTITFIIDRSDCSKSINCLHSDLVK